MLLTKRVRIPMQRPAQRLGGYLRVPFYPQRLSNWCWAACVEMVTAFRHAPVTQCYAASVALNFDCCADPVPCNQAAPTTAITDLWNRLGRPAFVKGALRWEDLVYFTDPAQDLPVEVGVVFNAGHGHVVLATGTYTTIYGDDWVNVNDPGAGAGALTYDFLRTGNGTWKWTTSWFGM